MSKSLLPSSLMAQFGGRDADTGAQEPMFDVQSLGQLALCVVFILLVVLGPLIAQVTSDGASEGSSFRQFAYLLTFGAAIWFAAPWKRGWSMIAMPTPMLVALLWCWISLFWAVEPSIAFRRLLLTTMVIWTVFIIVHSIGYRKAVDGLRIGMMITLLLNYITVWVDPNLGMHLGGDAAGTALVGNWRGIMTHKNFAGASCAMTILLFTFDSAHINKILRGVVMAAAAYFLVRSVSKTSIGMAVAAGAVGYSYNLLSRQLRILLLPAIVVVLCIISTIFSAYRSTLESLYMAPTAFTGRGQIWGTLMLYIKDHWLLGAGFESFWNVGGNSPVFTYGKGFVTTITVGHNGYLDLLVTVGVPGLVLIVWGALIWPLLRIISSERVGRQKGALLCAMTLFCIGHNVTESSLFERDALIGVFTIFAAAFAAYALPGSRKSRRSSSRERESGKDLMAEMKARRSTT